MMPRFLFADLLSKLLPPDLAESLDVIVGDVHHGTVTLRGPSHKTALRGAYETVMPPFPLAKKMAWSDHRPKDRVCLLSFSPTQGHS
jgi:hypothetical protein